jgi:hypothetical protein
VGADKKEAAQDFRTEEQKQQDVRAGTNEADAVLRNNSLDLKEKLAALNQIKARYRMTELKFIYVGERGGQPVAHAHGEINPTYDAAGYVLNLEPLDAVVIEGELGAPAPRQGLEEVLEPASKVAGIPNNWQRCHSLGAGFGIESIQGIYYCSPRVNLQIQNSGIEQYIRDIYTQKHPNAVLRIRTVTRAHQTAPAAGQRLASISYRLTGQMPGASRPITIYEVDINVQDAVPNPDVEIDAVQYGDLERFLR